MQISRETSYEDLQKLMLKEMAPILHDDVLTASQPPGVSIFCILYHLKNYLYLKLTN